VLGENCRIDELSSGGAGSLLSKILESRSFWILKTADVVDVLYEPYSADLWNQKVYSGSGQARYC
jgi:hypothetical protein